MTRKISELERQASEKFDGKVVVAHDLLSVEVALVAPHKPPPRRQPLPIALPEALPDPLPDPLPEDLVFVAKS